MGGGRSDHAGTSLEDHASLLLSAWGYLLLETDNVNTAGSFEFAVEALDLPGGVYIYRLASGGGIESRRLIVRR